MATTVIVPGPWPRDTVLCTRASQFQNDVLLSLTLTSNAADVAILLVGNVVARWSKVKDGVAIDYGADSGRNQTTFP